jgi:exodeoxyribonuclease-3
MNIKISSFNVNSIRARLPAFHTWIKNSNPDIILLQEIKSLEETFPFDEFPSYNIATLGQKTYNGVAILSKFRIEDVQKNLPNFDDDEARYIEAVVSVNSNPIKVASVYVPNGSSNLQFNEELEGSKRFQYKIDFLQKLKSHFQNIASSGEMAVFGGDFNVATDEIDVHNPKKLSGSVCFHPLERRAFQEILNLGIVDIYRKVNPQKQEFSWFDYRGGSYQKNNGLRIDYVLSVNISDDKITSAMIENDGVRNGEKPSDHCPVSIILEL